MTKHEFITSLTNHRIDIDKEVLELLLKSTELSYVPGLDLNQSSYSIGLDFTYATFSSLLGISFPCSNNSLTVYNKSSSDKGSRQLSIDTLKDYLNFQDVFDISLVDYLYENMYEAFKI